MSAFPRLFLQTGDEGFEQMILMFQSLNEPFPETLILLPLGGSTLDNTFDAFQCGRAIFIRLRFEITPLFRNTAQESG
jgi:hypothetical protein